MKKNLQSMKLHGLYTLLFTLFIFNYSAQLTGYSGLQKFNINNPGTAKSGYPVLLEINTASYVTNGDMKANGDDIRFGTTCDGSTLLPFWIETGINTTNTKIWVRVDALPANGQRTIFMFFNNSGATAASDRDATFTSRRIVTGIELADSTVWTYDWIEIAAGGELIVDELNRPGSMTFNAPKIIIAGSLNGLGAGHAGGIAGAGSGPGAGTTNNTGGGGAGHGGPGGRGSWCCSRPDYAGGAGPAYGNSSNTTNLPGSGGGAPGLVGSGAPGGDGGAAIWLNGTDIEISGVVDANGAAAPDAEYCGGGGSGGGVLIRGYHVNVSGTIKASGGKGGSTTAIYYGGGGGGGGRIKILHHGSYNNTGFMYVDGGVAGIGGNPEGDPGQSGTIHTASFTSDIPLGTTVTGGSGLTINSTINNHVSCFGGSDGSASFTIPAGGTYDFVWSDGTTTNASATTNNANLSVGRHTVTITDPNDACAGPFIDSVIITEPDAISVGLSAQDANCGGSDGVAFIQSAPQGGTGTLIYTWSNQATSDTIFNLTAGTYDLVITDDNNCSHTESIVIGTTNPPTITIDAPANFCSADTIPLGEIGGEAIQWSWTSDGNAIFSDNSVNQPSVHNIAQGETFTVIGTDQNGCTTTESVVLNPALSPNASASSAGTICSGNNLSLFENGGTAGVQYTWSSNMNASFSDPNDQNPTASNVSHGEIFTVLVSDPNSGCTNSSTVTAAVVTTPTIDPITDVTACGEATLPTISGSDLSGNEAYFELSGGTGNAIANGSQVNFSDFASYPVTLYAYDGASGCESEVAFSLTIHEMPDVTQMTAGGDFCPDDNLEVSLDLSGIGPWNITYSIDGNSQTTTANSSPFILGNNPGVYLISLLEDANCTNTISATEIYNLISVDTSLTYDGTTFSAQASSAQFQWIDCDNGEITGATSGNFSPQADGFYAVIVNQNGCTDTSACFAHGSASLSSNTLMQARIFPNPTKGNLTIQWNQSMEEALVSVQDLNGKVISLRSVHQTNQLNLQLDAAPGMYWLIIENQSGDALRQKFVIE